MTHHDDARGLCALWTTRASLRNALSTSEECFFRNGRGKSADRLTRVRVGRAAGGGLVDRLPVRGLL